MFSLNPRDQLLIAALAVATVVGAAVKHWRDARREAHAFPVRHESMAPARIQTAPRVGTP